MQRKLYTVTFSPTGSSKSVTRAIAQGLGSEITEDLDITLPSERQKHDLLPEKDDLVIFAMPTYAGRLPELACEWLQEMKVAPGTPAICVVLYGNREFDDSLIELRDLVVTRGYKPIAGAAFIGEHSFSNKTFPVAAGRPHKDDLDLGIKFGWDITAHFDIDNWVKNAGALQVPGAFPYKDKKPPKVDFIAVSDACNSCGTCVTFCPADAIDAENGFATIVDKCILCCACIRACPENARSMKPGPVMDISKRLHENCSIPKRPTFYWPE